MASDGPSLTDDLKRLPTPTSAQESLGQITTLLQSKHEEILKNRNNGLNKLKRIVVAKNKDNSDVFQVAIEQLSQLKTLIDDLSQKEKSVEQLRISIQKKQNEIDNVSSSLTLSDPRLTGTQRIESEIRLINNKLAEISKKEKEAKQSGNIASGQRYQDMPAYLKITQDNQKVLTSIKEIESYLTEQQKLVDSIARMRKEMASYEKAGNANDVVQKMKSMIENKEKELQTKFSPQKIKAKQDEKLAFQSMLEANKDTMTKLQRDFHQVSPLEKEKAQLMGKLESLKGALSISDSLKKDEASLKTAESKCTESSTKLASQIETIVSKTKNEEIRSLLSEGLNRIKPTPPKNAVGPSISG